MRMDCMVPVSVVIPTYNRTNVLFDTIRSIVSGKKKPSEVIVIDQTSPATVFPEDLKKMMTDGMLTVLHESIPSLTRSRNIGLRRASNDIVLFCDDDILVDENTIEILYQRMRQKNILLVAGITKDENCLFGGNADSSIKSVFSTAIGLKKFWRKDGYVVRGSMRGRYAAAISEPSKTEWAMGYFFCIKKSFCERNDLWFDEKLIRYAYAEDLDFTLRYCRAASNQHFQTIVDPTLYVDHLASKEWRTPSRAAAFYTVINRRYLSYKIYPRRFWYRWFIKWSDKCWELFGCKTTEEKKNWHDAMVKCDQYTNALKDGDLNMVYE